jgi:hypothetical protein
MFRGRTLLRVAVVLGAVMAAESPIRAEVILGPPPVGTIQSYYYRFSNSFPDDPTTTATNPSFYLSTVDFSGVGWRLPGIFGPGGGSAWNVTMIDNIHFISNWHLNTGSVLNVGDTVNFRPFGSSTTLSRTVANLQQVTNLGFSGSGIPDGSPSDVLLGTLNAPFSPGDGIAAYPIAAAGTLQQTVYMYGRESAVGRNNFGGLIAADVGTGATVSFRMDYDQPNSNPDGLASLVGPDEAHYNQGDSGGPTFVLVGGQLQLLGGNMFIQSYGDPGEPPLPPGVTDPVEYSGSTYLPAYVAQINALIAVPEPTSLALGSVAAAGALVSYLRRRRRPAQV